jgi:hypothetical protein
MNYAYHLVPTPLPAWIEYDGMQWDTQYQTQAQLAAQGWLQLYYEPPGELLGYADPVEEAREGQPVAVAYAMGTEAQRDKAKADATRSDYRAQIDAQRRASDQAQIDLRFDPGLTGVVDEANARASAKLRELGATTDADLGAFNPSLASAAVSAVALAQSLATQERAFLERTVGLAQGEIDEVLDSISAHEAVVAAGDPNAQVYAPPPVCRRHVGVAEEGYGDLELRRVQSGGWWWLEAALTTKRDLSGGQYWLAFYTAAANDTANDPFGYLTTAQLTSLGDGRYVADKAAINLPATDTSQGYKVTLCYGHLSNEQFDRCAFDPGELYNTWRVRWAGKAS